MSGWAPIAFLAFVVGFGWLVTSFNARASKRVAVAWLVAWGVMATTDSVAFVREGAWPVAVIFMLAWMTFIGLFLAMSHWDWLYLRLPNWVTGKR